jgi:hypothetical protein
METDEYLYSIDPDTGNISNVSPDSVYSTGDVETWSAKMTPEEFEEKIQAGFERYKENFLKNFLK